MQYPKYKVKSWFSFLDGYEASVKIQLFKQDFAREEK